MAYCRNVVQIFPYLYVSGCLVIRTASHYLPTNTLVSSKASSLRCAICQNMDFAQPPCMRSSMHIQASPPGQHDMNLVKIIFKFWCKWHAERRFLWRKQVVIRAKILFKLRCSVFRHWKNFASFRRGKMAKKRFLWARQVEFKKALFLARLHAFARERHKNKIALVRARRRFLSQIICNWHIIVQVVIQRRKIEQMALRYFRLRRSFRRFKMLQNHNVRRRRKADTLFLKLVLKRYQRIVRASTICVKDFFLRVERKLLDTVFVFWNYQTVQRINTRMFLYQSIFASWREISMKSMRKRITVHRTSIIGKKVFRRWKHISNHAKKEEFRAQNMIMLVRISNRRKCFQLWRRVCLLARIKRQHGMVNVFQNWHAFTITRSCEQSTSVSVKHRRLTRIFQRIWCLWRAACDENLAMQNARCWRSQRYARCSFSIWKLYIRSRRRKGTNRTLAEDYLVSKMSKECFFRNNSFRLTIGRRCEHM